MSGQVVVGHIVEVPPRMGRHKGEQFTPELLWLVGVLRLVVEPSPIESLCDSIRLSRKITGEVSEGSGEEKSGARCQAVMLVGGGSIAGGPP